LVPQTCPNQPFAMPVGAVNAHCYPNWAPARKGMLNPIV
jgi:hypothetical protein